MHSFKTAYSGFYFNSRLEARWKIFYEALDEPAAYEPEAIDLGAFAYTPDYWLTLFRAWVEIKGEMISEEAGLKMIEKCRQLAIQSGNPVILCFSDPFDPKCAIFIKDRMYSNAHWTACPYCGRLAIAIRSDNNLVVWCPESKTHQAEPLAAPSLSAAKRRIYDAAVKARSHRFGVSRKTS